MSCWIKEAGEYVELKDIEEEVACKECSKDANRRTWYEVEGGAVNRYYSIFCPHCGYDETDWSNP